MLHIGGSMGQGEMFLYHGWEIEKLTSGLNKDVTQISSWKSLSYCSALVHAPFYPCRYSCRNTEKCQYG